MKLLDYLGIGSGINDSAPSSAPHPVAQQDVLNGQSAASQQLQQHLYQPQHYSYLGQLGQAAAQAGVQGGYNQYQHLLQSQAYLPTIKHEFTPEMVEKFEKLYTELNLLIKNLPPDAVSQLSNRITVRYPNRVYLS